MKTKTKKIFKTLSVSLSVFLAVAVFLTATHAKDIVSPVSSSPAADANTANTTVRQIEKPIDKSIGDLHSHVDKTMVKSMAKAVSGGDNAVMQNARREQGEINEEQPLSVRMIEMMLMIKLAYAYAIR